MSKKTQKIKLVYTDWATNSNKEYNVKLFEVYGDTYQVECTYGRRYQVNGYSLKTPRAVSYHKALQVFDKIVTQKIGKGYEIIRE